MSSSARRHVISRAYLREIGQHLLLVLGGATFLASLAAAVRASSTSQGAPLWISLSLLPLLIANVLPYLIPIALMTAVVICYGRMAADGEATALRVAGVSPWRLLFPALIAGATVGILSYPLSSQLIPRAYEQMRVLSNRLKVAALENTNPGSSGLHFRGLDMSWSRVAADGSFLDVVLTHQDSRNHRAFTFDALDTELNPNDPGKGRLRLRADRATMALGEGQMEFTFWGMRTISEGVDGQSAWSLRNTGPAILRFDLDGILGEYGMPDKGDLYTSSEMRHRLSNPGEVISPVLEHAFRYTLMRRVVIALAAIPMAMLGALLGWRMRKSGLLGAFLGTFALLLFLYYPLFLLSDSLSLRPQLNPELAALVPLIGLFIACVFGSRWLRRC